MTTASPQEVKEAFKAAGWPPLQAPTRTEVLEVENAELKAEVARLNRVILLSEQSYPVHLVAEMLWARGFVSDEPTATVVHEYAWNHPDWFRGGVQTAEGAKYIRLGPNGLEFTHEGVNKIIDQFIEGN